MGKANTPLDLVPVDQSADCEAEHHGEDRVHRRVMLGNCHEAEGAGGRAEDGSQHVERVIEPRDLVCDELHCHQTEEEEDASDGWNEVKRPAEEVAAADAVGEGQNKKRREGVPSARRREADSGKYSRIQGRFLTSMGRST